MKYVLYDMRLGGLKAIWICPIALQKLQNIFHYKSKLQLKGHFYQGSFNKAVGFDHISL